MRVFKIFFILSVFLFFLPAGDPPTGGLVFASNPSDVIKIDINTAPLEDLVKIIHIGEVRALELTSLRPFSSIDELARIKGVGKKRIEDIKKQGLAWVNATDPELVVQPEPQPLLESSDKEKENLAESGSPLTYSSGIIINEILPSPKGPDSEEEWIEIFNKNNFEVNISQWKIQDTTGAVTAYTFPEGTKISAEGFLVLKRTKSKITLNNSEDGLEFLNPDKKIIDKINYEKASLGQSFNRTLQDFAWSTTLTPGEENVIIQPEVQSTGEQTKEEKAELTPKSNSVEKIPLAKISEQFPKKSSNSLIIFLIAIAIAVGSAIIVVFLKKKTEDIP